MNIQSLQDRQDDLLEILGALHTVQMKFGCHDSNIKLFEQHHNVPIIDRKMIYHITSVLNTSMPKIVQVAKELADVELMQNKMEMASLCAESLFNLGVITEKEMDEMLREYIYKPR